MFARLVAQQTVKRATLFRPATALFRPTVSSFSTEELVPGIGYGKTSTGIVGLPVDHNSIEKIVTNYQALLDKMATSDMPETAQYRMDVEKIARYRIQVALDHPDDPDKVEELCQCGQVEELVEQAFEEMEVLDMYLKERMWERVNSNVTIDVETNPDPSEDNQGIEEDYDDEDFDRTMNKF